MCLYFSDLELYFVSAAAAASAADSLSKMHESIEVDYGHPLPVVDNLTAGKFQARIYISRQYAVSCMCCLFLALSRYNSICFSF